MTISIKWIWVIALMGAASSSLNAALGWFPHVSHFDAAFDCISFAGTATFVAWVLRLADQTTSDKQEKR